MMTIEQARDRAAELLGWKRVHICGDSWGWTYTNGARIDFHPIPLTLDGVAKLWPDGWVTEMKNDGSSVLASAWPLLRPVGVYLSECVPHDDSADTELHARLLLLVAVLEHIAKEKGE